MSARLPVLIIVLALPCVSFGLDFGDLPQVPQDFLQGIKEEGKPEGLLTILAAGAAAGAATSGDAHLHDNFQRNTPLGKRATDTGALMGNGALLFPLAGAAYFAGACARSESSREFGLMGFEALAISGVETLALKYAVQRKRPDGSPYSFPSGHASASFSLATVAAWQYGWEAGVPAYFAAGFVGYTRMESQKHYLSDVLFGAGLGIAAGRAVYKSHRRMHPGRFTFVPYFWPGGGGVALIY